MNYGRAIKTLCAVREMSQQDLAKAMDADEAFISRVVTKDGSPRMETLERIAVALDVPLFLLVLLAEDDDLPSFEKEQAQVLGALFLELLVPTQRKK